MISLAAALAATPAFPACRASPTALLGHGRLQARYTRPTGTQLPELKVVKCRANMDFMA
jgi:hypothetical protein